jgi:hypothetical protein
MDGPSECDIPPGATYAVATNIDWNAVNDGIFAKHLAATHYLEKPTRTLHVVPEHTILIRASNVMWKKASTYRQYTPFNKTGKDIIYGYCGDSHLFDSRSSRRVDPFMKVYYDRPIMLNNN